MGGRVYSPSDVLYRANIDALKRLGATKVISISACGSFHNAMAPGDFVLVDQFIDRTFAREKSFFGTGCVAHVSVAQPTCARLSTACFSAAANSRYHGASRRHLNGDGRPTVFHPRLKQGLP
jgi:5'-methylthioadenosine phosphorylase